jgi:hypothetical protein
MPRLEFSRLRPGKAGPAGDRGDQPSKIWQALLGPFSLRPPEPPRPDAKPVRVPRRG